VIVILSTHIVEDIHDLCKNMVILAEGEIVAKGNPSQLIKSIEGKVWSKMIKKQDVDAYRKAFKVILTKLVSGETQIRVISDSSPEQGFDKVNPNLEDFYFAAVLTNSPLKTA
jgi:ABC-type multidrug transport system ATPase subunit